MATSSQNTYHDTVSKMARKYSQHQLPQPSELTESDDEYNEYSPSAISYQSDNEFHNDTHSAINHHQIDINDTYDQLPNYINVNILENKTREIQMDRELFTSIFDKYFDEAKEGDVDFEEFKNGLLKLGVNINNKQISKLFDVLLMSGDNENDGYLDCDQFIDFLTRRFEAPQLVAFQDLLLSIIMEKTKKDKYGDALFNANKIQKWDPLDASLQEMEMTQAMEQMVDTEMQKINESQMKTYENISFQQLEITEYVTNHTIYPFETVESKELQQLKIQTHILKNDLSETRLKLRQLQIQCDEYKIKALKQRKSNTNISCLSPSSVYSNNNDIDNHSDATTMTPKPDVLNEGHLRRESNATQETAYSDGDTTEKLAVITEISPTPPLPQEMLSPNWQKYINNLETKNRELSTLFVRADNNLKKYMEAIIPFQERIQHLAIQNQTRKKTIDQLNKRMERRNKTINKLKKQVEINMNNGTSQFMPLDLISNVSFDQHNAPFIPNNAVKRMSSVPYHRDKYVPKSIKPTLVKSKSVSINDSSMNQGVINHKIYPYSSSNRSSISSKHRQYHSSRQLFAKKKKKKRKSRKHHQNKSIFILANDANYINPQIAGYMSGSAGPIPSEPPNNDNEDNSILGSLTSMAYGYLMGSGTSSGN